MTSPIQDFELPATGQQRFASAAFKGHSYVLFFYPKDDTTGCTAEGIQFRDLHRDFLAARHMVFGVSRDSLASHERYKAKYDFPFDLLSDPEELVCKRFGVIKEKSLYGRKYMGIERSTFVMAPDGRIAHEWRGVKVPGHAQEVLATVLAGATSKS